MVKAPSPESTDVRLVDLAADHIRQFGLGRTTVVSIAEAAGMSHANVYRYFPSKAALVDAVIEAWLKPIEKGLRDIADGPDPARDKLERLASAIHRAYRRKVEDDAAIFKIFVTSVRERGALFRRHRSRIVSEVQRVVDEGMASGSFAVDNQRDAISLFMDSTGRFLGPEQVWLDRDIAASEVEIRLDRVLQLVLRGISSGRI